MHLKANTRRWEVIFSLPASDDRWLASHYAFDSGDIVAVGKGTIVHVSPDRHVRAVEPPENSTLMDVWGPNTSELFAVGSAGLIMRFHGGAWTIERPAAEKSKRDPNLLYAVGPFLSDTVVAFGPKLGLKRQDDAWSNLSSDERSEVYGFWGRRGPSGLRAPCPTGVFSWQATRNGRLWVTCQDHMAFLLGDKQQFEARGEVPKPCEEMFRSEYWNESLYVTCAGKLWKNSGQQWQELATPDEARALSSTDKCLYASGRHAVMQFCK